MLKVTMTNSQEGLLCYQKKSDWEHLDSKHKVLKKGRAKSLQAGGGFKFRFLFFSCFSKYTGFLQMKPMQVKNKNVTPVQIWFLFCEPN